MENQVLKAYIKDIFFELMVHKNAADSIIILGGFPTKSEHKEEIIYLHKKGYNVFWPHYPGNYQSRGKFLEKNVVEDISEFVKELKKGKVNSLWDMQEIRFKIKKLTLFGTSFSGAICCGLASVQNFNKMVLFAPVWDFKKHNQHRNEQDIDSLIPFVKRAYENLIRFEWDCLSERINKFFECSPQFYISKLKLPILVLHDPNDRTVSIDNTIQMSKLMNNVKVVKHEQGHGMMNVLKKNWIKVNKFISD